MDGGLIIDEKVKKMIQGVQKVRYCIGLCTTSLKPKYVTHYIFEIENRASRRHMETQELRGDRYVKKPTKKKRKWGFNKKRI